MNTPLPDERKILSNYGEVSRTFTYGILAALPLFAIYQIGLPYVNEGKRIWAINGIDMFLQKTIILMGVSPQNVAPLAVISIIIGSFAAIQYEKKRHGMIQPRLSFLFFTLNEALPLSLLIGPVLVIVCYGYLPHMPFAHGFLRTPPLNELLLLATTRAGAGFYEELFWRVMLLGGLLQMFRLTKTPRFPGQVIALVLTSSAFSGLHFTSMFGLLPDEFTLQSFVYRTLLGMFYGVIYLKRGFAGAAWTHTFANIWIDMNVL